MGGHVSCGVDDIKYFATPVSYTVWNYVRQAGDNQFARPVNASLATHARIAREVGCRAFNTLFDGPRSRRIVFRDIDDDLRERTLAPPQPDNLNPPNPPLPPTPPCLPLLPTPPPRSS